MLDLQNLAAKYAGMQHNAILHADDAALRRHITDTLRRCLPPQAVTLELVEACFRNLHHQPDTADPMHTGGIHAFAGQYLLETASDEPLLQRLHESALRLLPRECPASRDDLRLVVLDALYKPGILPPGTHLAYVNHRLGLKGPRLSCEEIALRMHKPLVYIYELENAILTILSAEGDCHA